MRVVITGGSGFVGSHFCERFLHDGHEVVCVDNYITGSPRNTEHLLDDPGFTRIEHDVSRVCRSRGRSTPCCISRRLPARSTI